MSMDTESTASMAAQPASVLGQVVDWTGRLATSWFGLAAGHSGQFPLPSSRTRSLRNRFKINRSGCGQRCACYHSCAF